MDSASRIATPFINFGLPGTTELRATVGATKIASVIKINFNVTRDCIFFSCAFYNFFIVFCGPRFTGAIMSIT
jgi:hypothetical protein